MVDYGGFVCVGGFVDVEVVVWFGGGVLVEEFFYFCFFVVVFDELFWVCVVGEELMCLVVDCLNGGWGEGC